MWHLRLADSNRDHNHVRACLYSELKTSRVKGRPAPSLTQDHQWPINSARVTVVMKMLCHLAYLQVVPCTALADSDKVSRVKIE